MQQFLTIWNALETKKRVIVLAATAAMFAGVLSLGRLASQPDLSLLYSGLSLNAAGEVVAALEAQDVAYDVRGNAIFVDNTKRDELRLTLASEGLPANGSDGYELLDTLSGFGTTSQMFDIAFLRAKEGELARTILANPQIKAARVHIAPSDQSPFRQQTPTKASVSLRAGGSSIPPASAEAIRYLVASAVAGLSPEDVSVIDADNGLVINGQDPSGLSQMAERAEVLKRNVERLMLARVGAGNAIVEVNVETQSDEELIREQRFDPDSRVAISTETQETAASSDSRGGGGVTVASNLPEGEGAGDQQSSDQNNDTREIINYEVSETTRELRRGPGAIKKISVAVLVNGLSSVDDAGAEAWAPRPDEELQTLEALVKSAIGFDAERGDEVTIRSMALEAVAQPVAADAPGWVSSSPFEIMSLAKLAITGLVVLILGLFVIRPILTAPAQLTAPAPTGLLPDPALGNVISGEVQQVSADNVVQPGIPALPTVAASNEDPVERLKSLIQERQDETIEVLKNWIEDTGEAIE